MTTNITTSAIEEVMTRFRNIEAKIKQLDAEILPLKPEAARLRPAVARMSAVLSDAETELARIFDNTLDGVMGAASEALSKVETAADELVATVHAELGRDVGPMEAA